MSNTDNLVPIPLFENPEFCSRGVDILMKASAVGTFVPMGAIDINVADVEGVPIDYMLQSAHRNRVKSV